MKAEENYLWDKTGEDAEIEALENALEVFRYRENAPPALALPMIATATAKVLPFRKEAPRRTFHLALAAAACLLFGIMTLGIWIQLSGYKTQITENSPQTNETRIVTENSPVEQNGKTEDSPVENVEKPKQPLKLKPFFARYAAPAANAPRQQTKAQKNIKKANKPTSVQLTKEEQYAYDQLMLALSITGSKLKTVRDKVEGIEENSSGLKTDNN